MHFSISVIGNKCCFSDIVLPCYYALTSLGWKCDIRTNTLSRQGTNIIFGAHSLPDDAELPPRAIIYNFEQLSRPFFNEVYVRHMKEAAAVWDFSEANVAAFRERFRIEATHVFPGYVPEMTCLNPNAPTNVNLLFYGGKTDRRNATLEAIQQKGLEPMWLYAFGHKRDSAVARAAIHLNVHAVTPASLEVARLGFLWANKKAVLSEDCPEHGIPEGLEDACLYTSYENLPEAALMLHQKPALREGIAQRGFEAFRAKPLAPILEKIVGRPVQAVPARIVPNTLNVGSGTDFMAHCLNIDISPAKNPDLLLDLSQPMDWEQTFQTVRFGEIRLTPGSFRKIVVHHVLEHIRDLTQMMHNFLMLLEPGGELEIGVPYDLSHGAWQDPTHVRAFNEKSWDYFCGMHGYLGWRDFCFELVDMEFELSKVGKQLQAQGMPHDELMRTPRAVDAMNVILRKREATAEEKRDYGADYTQVYDSAFPVWKI